MLPAGRDHFALYHSQPLALVALLVVVFCGVPLKARLADLADFSATK